ncbi:Sensor protein SphS [Acaryochloris thomasi RCC1774]|uniref:histidine kinase n=1 Tax=Acaryochloris thomasi RCC1774 TaxID=1764569 RepID=A0A2W1JK10_9CYAN|nr:PAS domain-containing sensor histidine kinase [Acaryochloris thomasi]PZD73760.1 Sensor protein SphS [Acaryochloris thomasi RCC1774]
MAFVWFLCGLAVGLGLFVESSRRLNRRLAEMLRLFSGGTNARKSVTLGQFNRLLTQSRTEQRDLQQQALVWRNILKAAPIGYLEVDGADQIHWYNSTARQLLKIDLSPRLTEGRLLLQVVRSLELEKLIRDVRQSQQSNCQDWIVYTLPIDGLPGTAQSLPLRGYGIPLPDLHVGVFVEDRQEATTLTQERDRWASDVAHELKTPLTSIRLMVETLQSQIEPSLHNWTERLLNETTRLSNLVQDVLELSHVSGRNEDVLCLSAVDLPALVRSAWLNLEPLAQQRNLALYYQGPDHLSLQADEARLYRVLVNIIDNGIKHSHYDQAIMIEIGTEAKPQTEPGQTEEADWVVIDIIDAGDGFPPVAIAHIFKRFFRADTSRVRTSGSNGSSLQTLPATGSGSGLGLAIVAQIVAAHGGRVEAQNHPKTGGAWLRILLPHSL